MEERAERTCFGGVFFLFHSPHSLNPGRQKVMTLALAPRGREGTDWVVGCRTFAEKIFSPGTISNSFYLNE